MVLFKNTEETKEEQPEDWPVEGRLLAEQQSKTAAAASELCTRTVLIEKLTEQVKVCRVHMARRQEANTAYTGQAAFTKYEVVF